MEHSSVTSSDLVMPAASAAQFSYHVRMAAVFSVAGDTEESASESVLAWTILATCWDGAARAATATASELIGQDQAGVSSQARDAAAHRAHALALEMEAHFTSIGQRAESDLYASVAEHLVDTIGTLVNPG